MTDKKTDNFNITPLIFEIENVIKKGVHKILKEYIDRTEMLENAHKQILSVLNELNNDEPYIHDKEDTSLFVNVKDTRNELVNDKVKHVEEAVFYIENKLEKLEKNYDAIVEFLDKIFNNVKTLNEDIKLLKTESKTKEQHITSSSIKPLIVSSCENENIKFEINEELVNLELDQKNEEKDVKQILVETEEEETEDEETEDEETEDEETEDEETEEEETLEEQKETEEEETEEEETLEEQKETEEEETEEEHEETVEETVEEQEETVEETEEEETEEEEIETECSSGDENEEVVEQQEEVDEEFFEIEIDDVTYCTTNEENGIIYQLTEDGDVGEKIGYLKEGEPFFYADEN